MTLSVTLPAISTNPSEPDEWGGIYNTAVEEIVAYVNTLGGTGSFYVQNGMTYDVLTIDANGHVLAKPATATLLYDYFNGSVNQDISGDGNGWVNRNASIVMDGKGRARAAGSTAIVSRDIGLTAGYTVAFTAAALPSAGANPLSMYVRYATLDSGELFGIDAAGFVHLGSQQGTVHHAAGVTLYCTVSPDGTTATLVCDGETLTDTVTNANPTSTMIGFRDDTNDSVGYYSHVQVYTAAQFAAAQAFSPGISGTSTPTVATYTDAGLNQSLGNGQFIITPSSSPLTVATRSFVKVDTTVHVNDNAPGYPQGAWVFPVLTDSGSQPVLAEILNYNDSTSAGRVIPLYAHAPQTIQSPTLNQDIEGYATFILEPGTYTINYYLANGSGGCPTTFTNGRITVTSAPFPSAGSIPTGDTVWTTVTTSQSGSFQIRKDASGYVHCRGTVPSSATATLPAGYRPGTDMHMPGISDGTNIHFGYATYAASGAFSTNIPSSDSYCILDGHTFLAEG